MQVLDLLLPFGWAFMIAVFAIPSIVHVAHVKNLLDEPNFRTVHASLTPRLGGMAIFAGFMSALTIFGELTPDIQRVLAGCIVLFFIGLKDDIVSVSAFKKFFIQILATGIIMFIGDIRITSFQGVFGIYELEQGISYGITLMTIVGITNAINLIDGLDGLAGSIIMIITAAFGLAFFLLGDTKFYPYSIVAFCLMGGIVGFLRYNVHKAIVFMGDTGSLVCGFLVAVLAIQFIEMKAVPSSPALAVSILSIPLFDTLRVFSMRILRGKSPFAPDKNHIHHILLRMGFTQIATVLTLAFANLAIIAVVLTFVNAGNNYLLFGMFSFFTVLTVCFELFSRAQNKVHQQTTSPS